MKKRLLYKVNKKILYLGFFLIILSLTFFYLAKIELQKTTTKDYSELVMLGKDNKTAYVGLEINYLPYYVVNRTSNNVTFCSSTNLDIRYFICEEIIFNFCGHKLCILLFF